MVPPGPAQLGQVTYLKAVFVSFKRTGLAPTSARKAASCIVTRPVTQTTPASEPTVFVDGTPTQQPFWSAGRRNFSVASFRDDLAEQTSRQTKGTDRPVLVVNTEAAHDHPVPQSHPQVCELAWTAVGQAGRYILPRSKARRFCYAQGLFLILEHPRRLGFPAELIHTALTCVVGIRAPQGPST